VNNNKNATDAYVSLSKGASLYIQMLYSVICVGVLMPYKDQWKCFSMCGPVG